MAAGEDFEYVVERKEQDPCCFGTKVVRSTCPIGKGLSPFQKRVAPELFKTAPGYYAVDTSMATRNLLKVTSKKGYGPLASSVPRFSDRIHFITPAPGKHQPSQQWPPVKDSYVPFGSKVRRLVMKLGRNPGPGVYDLSTKKCRRTRFSYNLGHPAMEDTVEMFCTPKPLDTCSKCRALCEGDYWQRDYTIYLCHLCWLEEKYTNEIYDWRELHKFQKIRNCSFMHEHEGTMAKILTISKRKLKKKIRLENYLDLYLKC